MLSKTSDLKLKIYYLVNRSVYHHLRAADIKRLLATNNIKAEKKCIQIFFTRGKCIRRTIGFF